jgi:hypothetical protein
MGVAIGSLWMGVWLLALLLAVVCALVVHRSVLRTQPNVSVEPVTLHCVACSSHAAGASRASHS